MFHSGHWAEAFISSIEKQGGEIEDGIDALGALATGIKSLPGIVFGFSAAEQLEKLIREGIAKSADLRENTSSPALEAAVRFLVLMVRKNALCHIESVLDKARYLMNKKRGIVSVYLESAGPLTEDIEAIIKDAVVKRTGAAGAVVRSQIKPELIGGYRLRIEDKIIDASVRFQLRKLFGTLQSDQALVAVWEK